MKTLYAGAWGFPLWEVRIMALVINKECYIEFGQDLDGCSRQQNEGCYGCRCSKEVEDTKCGE